MLSLNDLNSTQMWSAVFEWRLFIFILPNGQFYIAYIFELYIFLMLSKVMTASLCVILFSNYLFHLNWFHLIIRIFFWACSVRRFDQTFHSETWRISHKLTDNCVCPPKTSRSTSVELDFFIAISGSRRAREDLKKRKIRI